VCAARYRRTERLHGAVDPMVVKALVLGVVFVAVSCLAGLLFDRNERQVILSWIPSGVRPVIGVVAAMAGLGLGLRAALPIIRRRTSIVASLGGTLLMPLLGILVLVLVLAFLQLTTVQALRTIVTLVTGAIGFVLLLQARSMAAKTSTSAFIGLGVLTAVALVVVAFVVRGDSEAARFRTGIFTVLVLSAVLLLANTFAEATYEKRTFVDTAADALGRRAAIIGLVVGAIGLGTRLLFSGAVFRMSVFWWLFATAIGAFVLTRTRYGNWIFSVGGNKEAARAIGVPASSVKTSLFVTTSLAGAFVGVMTLMRLNSVQAQQGDGQEFEFIIAAVVGGNLLTGGYGSVVGASLGAAIMAISKNGIPAARWNQDGRFIFLGAVLLLAVLVNNYIRRKAQEAR
jgi:ribose/xylose/arabinose/galactoside ABC-type transport system permease subunit